MAEPLSHFAEVDNLGGLQRQARILSYPKYYLDGDALTEADPRWVASDRPAISDWMMKRAVHSIYARNNGRYAVKHLGAAITWHLKSAALLRADRTRRLISTANFGTPTQTDESLMWTDVFPGIDFRLSQSHDWVREEIIITRAGRDAFQSWMSGSGESATGAYLAFVFEIDWRSLDGTGTFDQEVVVDDEVHQPDDTRETSGRILFRKGGHVKALMPDGYATHEDGEFQARKLRRFMKQGAQRYYVVGVKLSDFAGWPDGTITLNDSITFQQGVQPDGGYSGCQDTYLKANEGTFNYGHATDCRVDRFTFRALTMFDVTDISSGATVTDAELYFKTIDGVSGANVGIHAGMVDWIEGTKAANLADAGEPCWNARGADGSGGVTTAWGADGGQAGTDYETTKEDTVTMAADETWYHIHIPIMVAAWVANSAVNFGAWSLRDTDFGAVIRTYSSEENTTADRPYLLVTYEGGGTDHEKAAGDTEGISDGLTRAVEYVRTASDAEGIADGLTKALGWGRTASDAEGISDGLTRASEYVRTASDAEGISDGLTLAMAYAQTVSDTEGVSDGLTKAVAYVRAVSDSEGISDSASSSAAGGTARSKISCNLAQGSILLGGGMVCRMSVLVLLLGGLVL